MSFDWPHASDIIHPPSVFCKQCINHRLATEVMGWDADTYKGMYMRKNGVLDFKILWNPSEDLNQTMTCAEKWFSKQSIPSSLLSPLKNYKGEIEWQASCIICHYELLANGNDGSVFRDKNPAVALSLALIYALDREKEHCE